jgi:hypothetical protein
MCLHVSLACEVVGDITNNKLINQREKKRGAEENTAKGTQE